MSTVFEHRRGLLPDISDESPSEHADCAEIISQGTAENRRFVLGLIAEIKGAAEQNAQRLRSGDAHLHAHKLASLNTVLGGLITAQAQLTGASPARPQITEDFTGSVDLSADALSSSTH